MYLSIAGEANIGAGFCYPQTTPILQVSVGEGAGPPKLDVQVQNQNRLISGEFP